MSYYMLGCYGPEEEEPTEIYKVPRIPGVSWMSGARIAQSIAEPIHLYLDPQHPGVMLPMYYKGVLVFSDEMVQAILAAGVDNLELFAATLHDPFLSRELAGYKVVNIVGTIAAADLSRSRHTSHGTSLYDVDFDSLEIDEAKANGALMFRLAENVTGIVVHERVKKSLLDAALPYLDFTAPQEWLG